MGHRFEISLWCPYARVLVDSEHLDPNSWDWVILYQGNGPWTTLLKFIKIKYFNRKRAVKLEWR